MLASCYLAIPQVKAGWEYSYADSVEWTDEYGEHAWVTSPEHVLGELDGEVGWCEAREDYVQECVARICVKMNHMTSGYVDVYGGARDTWQDCDVYCYVSYDGEDWELAGFHEYPMLGEFGAWYPVGFYSGNYWYVIIAVVGDNYVLSQFGMDIIRGYWYS